MTLKLRVQWRREVIEIKPGQIAHLFRLIEPNFIGFDPHFEDDCYPVRRGPMMISDHIADTEETWLLNTSAVLLLDLTPQGI